MSLIKYGVDSPMKTSVVKETLKNMPTLEDRISKIEENNNHEKDI